MDIKKLIEEIHADAIKKGWYDCPECKGGKITCSGADQCDHAGTECNMDDNCGEFEFQICNVCDGDTIDPNRNIGEMLMLVVSELSESLESHRCGKFADLEGYNTLYDFHNKHNFKHMDKITVKKLGFANCIKDTFEDEIADVFIRLFDLCGYLGISPVLKDMHDRIVPDNVGVALLDMVSFCVTIHGIYKWPPIDPTGVTEIKMAWLLSDMIAFCEFHNIPIEKHITAKMAYNRTRPYKHGKDY